jgi:hypothetical protein
MDAAALSQETIDYVAITRLQNEYADVVTRQSWDELVPLFKADCKIHLDLIQSGMDFTGPREIGEFIAGSLQQFEFFQFVILNVVIRVQDESHATGRMYMSELRQYAHGGNWNVIYGVYHDSYEKGDDGRWKFASRNYQSLYRDGRGDIFPFPKDWTGPVR